MDLSDCKILIASNGDETRILFNGVEMPACQKFEFSVSGGESPMMNFCGISACNHPPHLENEFFEHVERMLGYKLCPER